MPEKEVQYGELVKSFVLVLNQYRLYSEKHPATQIAARGFLAALQEILTLEPSLTLGFVGGRVIANEHPLDPKTKGLAGLLKSCERFGIESLTFERGVDDEEAIAFFKLMAMPPRTLGDNGGFSQAFEMASLSHIHLGTVRYQAVAEGEEVVGRSEEGEKALAKKVRRIDKMEDVIEYFLTGSTEEVTFDTERLGYEIQMRPKAVAAAMLRRTIEIEVVKKIVEVVEAFLKGKLAPVFVEAGEDFSQPIYTLAKEFKKSIREVGIKGAGDLAFNLERCGDSVKVEHMLKAYKEGDHKTLEKTARLCRKGAREKLKERLTDLGVEGDIFQKLFPETKKPRRSGKVSISREELEELYRIRDRFEEELSLRVAERTAALEQERMRAVQEKERMEAIVRNLGQALIAVDAEGTIQFMNPAAEKLLGINEDEGKGVSIHEFLREEHLLVLAKDASGSQANRAVEEIEVKSGNDETRRVLQASTAVIETEDGKVVGMLSVLSDSTKQKKVTDLKSRFVVSALRERRTASAGD